MKVNRHKIKILNRRDHGLLSIVIIYWSESRLSLRLAKSHSKHPSMCEPFSYKGQRYDSPCAVCHPAASIKVLRPSKIYCLALLFTRESEWFLFFSIHREVCSFRSAFFLRWDSDAQHKSRFKQKGVEASSSSLRILCHVHQWLSSIQMSCSFFFFLSRNPSHYAKEKIKCKLTIQSYCTRGSKEINVICRLLTCWGETFCSREIVSIWDLIEWISYGSFAHNPKATLSIYTGNARDLTSRKIEL